MESFKKALSVARSYCLSDGFKVEVDYFQDSGYITIAGNYALLQFMPPEEELRIDLKSSIDISFEALMDELAAFRNLEKELLPLLHKCVAECAAAL